MSDNSPEDHPHALAALEALSELHSIVFEGLESGVSRSAHFFEDDPEDDPWLGSHIARHTLVNRLRVDAEALDLVVERTPLSGVALIYRGYEIRVWKKCRNGYVQPPGDSDRRREFLTQTQSVVPGTEHYFAAALGPIAKVAYVWEVSEGGLSLWLASPRSFDEEHLWEPADLHWVIPVPNPVLAMSPVVDFSGDDESDDLPIELEETANEDIDQ